MSAAQPTIVIRDLGRMDYAAAWQLQRELAAARGADHIPDTLLWVEHPHTYTLGSAGDERNILLTADEIAARGITIHRADRGGDVTYHGPGQVVAYPLLKLPASSEGLHADVIGYVRSLEEVLIRALNRFGIAAGRLPGLTGAWVGLEGDELRGPAKIAAIGVRVTTRRVTMHGFALNVDPDLDYFRGIIPCGIPDKPVTSMAAWTGHALSRAEVIDALKAAFTNVFGRVTTEDDPHPQPFSRPR